MSEWPPPLWEFALTVWTALLYAVVGAAPVIALATVFWVSAGRSKREEHSDE